MGMGHGLDCNVEHGYWDKRSPIQTWAPIPRPMIYLSILSFKKKNYFIIIINFFKREMTRRSLRRFL